ncbi:ketosteroid isomerase-like protein [Rhizobium sp. BIGb0125]|uniref:nuclear transport factor 2 family protein n=1 Tax=Rhizobium sp. BIGb0125 TaxID=2940618 RepID=UPI002166C21D|nr:nuclear transport factor 2 family protein [Rhizobium sp. BIGb0125]MCS4241427.1 ketosteroid isomerase-like protein [Rhizobium sp. BIGb0125]
MTIYKIARSWTIIATLAFAASSAHANAGTAVSTDVTARNETIVKQAFEDWAERGGAFTRVVSPDVEWTVRGSGPYSRTYSGLDSFVNDASAPVLSRLSTPLKPVVKKIWAVDDDVIVRFDASATTTTNDTYSNEYLWILTMKDGLVVKSEAFLDMGLYQDLVDGAPTRTN